MISTYVASSRDRRGESICPARLKSRSIAAAVSGCLKTYLATCESHGNLSLPTRPHHCSASSKGTWPRACKQACELHRNSKSKRVIDSWPFLGHFDAAVYCITHLRQRNLNPHVLFPLCLHFGIWRLLLRVLHPYSCVPDQRRSILRSW